MSERLFKLPRFSLRLRLSISITAIVALFTLTNITYQISSQNRNLRLDNLQKAVQGQLASVTTRQLMQNQQKEILVLDALKRGGEETLSNQEISSALAGLRNLAGKVNQLGEYAYLESIDAYKQLSTSYAELDMLWKQFYTGYNSDQTPLESSIERSFDNTLALLGTFETMEIQAAEQLTAQLHKVSRFNDRVTLGIYLFTIALTVGLGYLLIRYTTTALKNLNVGTVRIGRGDLDYHIPVSGDDEIGDLTLAFNEMADKLRNAMAQVQQSKEKADQANRAKTNFLANMSHELRTPLNAIIGYSEMIIEVYNEEKQLDEKQAIEDLQHILSSGRHLLQLINDVLDLAKVESGNMTVLNETFDSVAIIRNLATTMLPLARKNNSQMLVQAADDIPPLYSDAVKFRQIFINLISNACKFTHDGKISIMASYNAGKNQLVYHVRDTGIGMSETVLDNIFQAFVQADAATSKKYGGTGLGLAICKQFIELMHGSLDVSSARGVGTTFTVTLPVKPVQPRIGELIPAESQQELGFTLTPPTHADLTRSLLASETEPGALALVALLDDASNDFAEGLETHCQTLGYSPTETRLEKLCEHHRPDFLCAMLDAGSATMFARGWQQLRASLGAPNTGELPALFMFCERENYVLACEMAARFDYTNRKRLTIPVRQHNPVARRGKAVLAGFDSDTASEATGQALRTALEKEAWQCEMLGTNADSSVGPGNLPVADLVFFALEIDTNFLYRELLALRDKLAHPEGAELLALPGIFMIANSNTKHVSSSRVLDRAALEIELCPPA
ncbi:MAG: ATP-binding protein [Pseudomonadales bacterium]